jgi:hypothetical protein
MKPLILARPQVWRPASTVRKLDVAVAAPQAPSAMSVPSDRLAMAAARAAASRLQPGAVPAPVEATKSEEVPPADPRRAVLVADPLHA